MLMPQVGTVINQAEHSIVKVCKAYNACKASFIRSNIDSSLVISILQQMQWAGSIFLYSSIVICLLYIFLNNEFLSHLKL